MQGLSLGEVAARMPDEPYSTVRYLYNISDEYIANNKIELVQQFKENPAQSYKNLEEGIFDATSTIFTEIASRVQKQENLKEISVIELTNMSYKLSNSLKIINDTRRLEEGKTTSNMSIAMTIEDIDRKYREAIMAKHTIIDTVVQDAETIEDTPLLS